MATSGNWEEIDPGCEQVAVGFTFEGRFHHTCISGSHTVNFCKHYSYFLFKVFFLSFQRKKSTLIATSEISSSGQVCSSRFYASLSSVPPPGILFCIIEQ